MKIVLVTGIYPPDIGGPATYVRHIAEQIAAKNNDVHVVTYGDRKAEKGAQWSVHGVSGRLPIVRWFHMAKLIKRVATDADIVYAFSSVSCGVPLLLSGSKKPKKILRLGGDFFWERYTDWGGGKSLRAFYKSTISWLPRAVMAKILNSFDHIVFSTEFQQQIYRRHYSRLHEHSVIENALPMHGQYPMKAHQVHTPFRLLFMGRFVPFKNIPALISAMVKLSDCYLTIVGEGPQDDMLRAYVEKLDLATRVRFVAPLQGTEKYDVFASHDALVLPSLTDISPNTALEAAAVGLPVLLTEEHGLSDSLSEGMCIEDLSDVEHIVSAVMQLRQAYDRLGAYPDRQTRSYAEVSSETLNLFATLSSS